MQAVLRLSRLQRPSLLLTSALVHASPAFAQSVSLDNESRTGVEPSPRPTALAPKVESITAPRAQSTPVQYPDQGQGDHEVVLELVITKSGDVSSAKALLGEPVFAAQAVEASRTWKFAPAMRGEQAIAAKVHFTVKFTAPVPVASTPAAGESMTAAPTKKRVPAKTAARDFEVTVQGTREEPQYKLGQVEIRDMPGAFGDPYRAIEALPGVVPMASGLPYFYVRGAPTGNVGYFFDGVPVPYLYHFAAGPGVLHPAFVDHVELYPGAYPARYGRYAGAIVAGDIAPPSYRFRGEANVRIVDSGAMLEVPFASGSGSVMAAGRYSYTAPVLSLINPNLIFNYWDYQTRARYRVNSKDTIELVAFGAHDYLSDTKTVYDQDPNNPYGNIERKARYTVVDIGFHRFDLRWDRTTRRSHWRQAMTVGLDRSYYDDSSVVATNRVLGMRAEYEHRFEGVTLSSGADVLYQSVSQHTRKRYPTDNNLILDPLKNGAVDNGNGARETPNFGFVPARKDVTAGVWLTTVIDVTPRVQIIPGFRLDVYTSGTRAALGPDPRINIRYQLSKRTAVTHGLAVAHQAPSYIVPVPGLQPSLAGGLQTSLQHSASVSHQLGGGFTSSLTAFQNVFYNLTDYVSTAQLNNSTGRSSSDIRSRGHAYGLELMVRRDFSRRLNGFVSYTLSRSLRTTNNVAGPASTDRTHVVNVVATYDLGRNWRLGGRWLGYSGIPVQVAYPEAARTPPRTPAFWRMDFKLQKRWIISAPNAWWGLSLEVLNTTLNKEAFSGNCNAYRCEYDAYGPVTVPSIGAEAAF
jgi:TonB family protein